MSENKETGVGWEEAKKRVETVLKVFKELDELGVRGPLGIPLDYPISRLEEYLEHIEKRFGNPELWIKEAESYARDALMLAQGYAEEMLLKDYLKKWGLTCIGEPVYSPREEKLKISLSIATDGWKPVKEESVPCSQEEFEKNVEVCNMRALLKLKDERCALLAKAVPTPFGYHNILIDPETLEARNLTLEAEKFLEKLKEELGV